MSKSSSVALGLVLGLIVGSVIVYGRFSLEINEYQQISTKLEESKTQLSTTSANLKNVEKNYEDLIQENLDLEHENIILTAEFSRTQTNWQSLSEDVLEFREDLNSYCVLNESFKRIFNSDELDKISHKVEEITKYDSDFWDATNSIQKYIRDDIAYVYDSYLPVIGDYSYYGPKDKKQLTGFQTYYRRNMYQSLDFTIEYEQGDCDDQALLEYAMIKYYQRYILGDEYRLFLVYMRWEDAGHLTVFQPVQGGKICILDPAGQYQTGSTNRLESKLADSELNKYQDYWSDENGPILELTFWIVDIDSGLYTESFKGSLDKAISYFET